MRYSDFCPESPVKILILHPTVLAGQTHKLLNAIGNRLTENSHYKPHFRTAVCMVIADDHSNLRHHDVVMLLMLLMLLMVND